MEAHGFVNYGTVRKTIGDTNDKMIKIVIVFHLLLLR